MSRKSYPHGYWPLVFSQAASLLNNGMAVSGEAAYWLARRMVDQSLGLKTADQGPKGQLYIFEHLALAS